MDCKSLSKDKCLPPLCKFVETDKRKFCRSATRKVQKETTDKIQKVKNG